MGAAWTGQHFDFDCWVCNTFGPCLPDPVLAEDNILFAYDTRSPSVLKHLAVPKCEQQILWLVQPFAFIKHRIEPDRLNYFFFGVYHRRQLDLQQHPDQTHRGRPLGLLGHCVLRHHAYVDSALLNHRETFNRGRGSKQPLIIIN